MESPKTFSSVEDECRYWKERAKQYHKEWTDVKQEYDEFVEQSRQMEAEMDATLDQKEETIRDLRKKLLTLERENESYKSKTESQNIEIFNLEKQFESIKKDRDGMKDYVRQLEQKNDDLERAHRILNESIVDFEHMLDKAYEKNALLELEVDEKEVLEEKLQRLMDETRDLKQELNVKARHTVTSNGGPINSTASLNGSLINVVGNGDIMLHDTTVMPSSPPISSSTIDNNKHNNTTSNLNNYKQQQQQGNTLKNKYITDPDNLINGNAMLGSSRTSALNIVADMLRKLNLDKALLCPKCDRFRCICDRPLVSSTSTSTISSSTSGVAITANSTNQNADSSLKRISRSIANTFGSKDSLDTTSSVYSTHAVTPDDMSLSGRFGGGGDGASGGGGGSDSDTTTVGNVGVKTLPNTNSNNLLRNNSRNTNSINFGTNIFKRFAERMSGNAQLFSPMSTRENPISSSPTLAVPSCLPLEIQMRPMTRHSRPVETFHQDQGSDSSK